MNPKPDQTKKNEEYLSWDLEKLQKEYARLYLHLSSNRVMTNQLMQQSEEMSDVFRKIGEFIKMFEESD